MNGGSDVTELKETAAEVAALIPRYSWELMDEEQRDALMEKVVLPRHGSVTSDGTTLTYGWWADVLAVTPRTVEARISRLRAKIEDGPGSPRAEPNTRTARAATTLKNPDSARDILADPEVRQSVRKALDTHYQEAPKPATAPQRSDEPLELLGLFRRVHKDVDRIIELVLDGKAVVSDAERAALVEEARWLRAASEHIETGLDAGSLEQSLREFQEEYL